MCVGAAEESAASAGFRTENLGIVSETSDKIEDQMAYKKCVEETASCTELSLRSYNSIGDPCVKECKPWDGNVMLLRHGKSQANFLDKTKHGYDMSRGDYDSPLASVQWAMEKKYCDNEADCKAGFEQVKAFQAENYCPPDVILISPMRRALQTAFIAFKPHLNSTDLFLDAHLQEVTTDLSSPFQENLGTNTTGWFQYDEKNNREFFQLGDDKNEFIPNFLNQTSDHHFGSKGSKDYWNTHGPKGNPVKNVEAFGVPDRYKGRRIAIVAHSGVLATRFPDACKDSMNKGKCFYSKDFPGNWIPPTAQPLWYHY